MEKVQLSVKINRELLVLVFSCAGLPDLLLAQAAEESPTPYSILEKHSRSVPKLAATATEPFDPS